MSLYVCYVFFFFFNDTATTEIYTLSLHDALPIFASVLGVEFTTEALRRLCETSSEELIDVLDRATDAGLVTGVPGRSEEHTSELQSQSNLVCRLLLEKKKPKNSNT